MDLILIGAGRHPRTKELRRVNMHPRRTFYLGGLHIASGKKFPVTADWCRTYYNDVCHHITKGNVLLQASHDNFVDPEELRVLCFGRDGAPPASGQEPVRAVRSTPAMERLAGMSDEQLAEMISKMNIDTSPTESSEAELMEKVFAADVGNMTDEQLAAHLASLDTADASSSPVELTEEQKAAAIEAAALSSAQSYIEMPSTPEGATALIETASVPVLDPAELPESPVVGDEPAVEPQDAPEAAQASEESSEVPSEAPAVTEEAPVAPEAAPAATDGLPEGWKALPKRDLLALAEKRGIVVEGTPSNKKLIELLEKTL